MFNPNHKLVGGYSFSVLPPDLHTVLHRCIARACATSRFMVTSRIAITEDYFTNHTDPDAENAILRSRYRFITHLIERRLYCAA